jgi:glycosyltransferase involved in cell wall biosynthesis
MAAPRPVTVTFVVPCYRLAHLLDDCVRSILDQSYTDFEVLIMDDCSPDETPAVARSFGDARVRHVRNETNLGHLRNYNKGIEQARGVYTWLISADDRLRSRDALARLVAMLDQHPDMGFAFSPAVKFDGTTEGGLNAAHGDRDLVFTKGEFLPRLLQANCVTAPAGLVRTRCYQRAGLFPLDMPFAGDWYLWSALALYFGVGYVAEPLVNYRFHDLNMTKTCMKNPAAVVAEGVAVRWRIRRLIEGVRDASLLRECKQTMGYYYASLLAHRELHDDVLGLDIDEFERSVRAYCVTSGEAAEIRALAYAAAADELYDAGERGTAREWYERALSQDRLAVRTWAKYAFLRLGARGAQLRDIASRCGRLHAGGTHALAAEKELS